MSAPVTLKWPQQPGGAQYDHAELLVPRLRGWQARRLAPPGEEHGGADQHRHQGATAERPRSSEDGAGLAARRRQSHYSGHEQKK